MYFPHYYTYGQAQKDDAPESDMAVFTFPLRTFNFSSASFISLFLSKATTSKVYFGVACHPGGAGIWLMQFGLTCSSTWQGGEATDSGFLYDFSIILMLATFIRFHVTISHCPSSSYSPSAAKYFSSRARLLCFHCARSSLLNLF